MNIENLVRPSILNTKEYVPGKPAEEVQRELGLTDVIKLSSNENPLGASPKAIEAMLRELRNSSHRYPEGTCPNVAAKLAEKLHLKQDQFYIDNGVDAVITILGSTFINPQDEILTSEYTFPAYANVASRMGAKAVLVPQLEGRRYDIDGLLAALTPHTKMVFIANPNNPTGTITPRDEFEKLLERVPETTLIISDEAYYDFASDATYPQSIPYMAEHPNLVVLRTFSKIMGLAGVRIGFAAAHADIIKMMMRVRDPFPVNRAAQAGALAALDDEEFMQRSITLVAEGRQQLYDALDELDIRWYPSQANFVLFELDRAAQPVFERMLREGVIVRPMGPQGLENCIRISVGTPEQNQRAMEALRKALQK